MSTPTDQPAGGGHKRHARPFHFNPLELVVTGYSNSGKTTLITRLVERLHTLWRVGYVKHGHHFQLDTPGKDSATVTGAGAARAALIAPESHALLATEPLDELLAPRLTLDADVVLAEGYKESDLPKILVVGEREHTHGYGEPFPFSHVIAAAGQGVRPAWLSPETPWFHRDDIVGLAGFVAEWFSRHAHRPLHGLVLTGGQSSRMGRDKAALDYHGKPQAVHVAELLERWCDQVFVSVQPGQEAPGGFTALPDTFVGFGPMGGILTALKSNPQAAWLVLACDLPFVTSDTLRSLLAGRNPYRAATAFVSSSDGLPEPLCGVYEPKSVFYLAYFLALGVHCPRKVLIHSPAELLKARDPHWLDNVNSPEEYEAARRRLASGGEPA